MNSPDKDPRAHTAPTRKKEYSSPLIHYYGAIRSITESVGNAGGSDSSGQDKTSG